MKQNKCDSSSEGPFQGLIKATFLEGGFFTDSIDFELEVDEDEKELFTNELNPNKYLDDFGLTVNELREQIMRDEKAGEMTKEEFFKSIEE